MDTRPIDADNHYYEPLDAFTRHLDRKFKDRGVRPVQDGKRTHLLIGGRLNRFVPNPTFDPIIVPGCIDPLFRGQIPEGVDPRSLMQVEPLRAEYRDRDRRVEVMDEQGLGGGAAVPDAGVRGGGGVAATTSPRPWRAWRRSTAGSTTTGASRTSDRLLRGRRCSRSPIPTARSRRSTGCSTGAHAWCTSGRRRCPRRTARADRSATSGSTRSGRGSPPPRSRWPSTSATAATTRASPRAWGGERHVRVRQQRRARPGARRRPRDPRHDRVAARARRVHSAIRRCASRASRTGPTGCTCSRSACASRRNQTPWSFAEDPLDTLRRHVWVTPYLEEDLPKLAELIGVERILFGSDWPHGEGVAQPLDFERELGGFDEGAVQRIMHDNCARAPRSGGVSGGAETGTGTEPRPHAEVWDDVTGWLGEHWDPDLTVDAWWKAVAAAGWTAPHLPVEQGGRGLGRRAQVVVRAAFVVVRRAAPARRPRAPHGGADDPRPGHARTVRPAGAADPRGPGQLVPAVQRARGRLRPRRPHHARDARRRPVGRSTGRRCGRAWPCSATTACCSPAPTSTCPSTRASRGSRSRSTNPASRSGRCAR